jgi:hypothetical protein
MHQETERAVSAEAYQRHASSPHQRGPTDNPSDAPRPGHPTGRERAGACRRTVCRWAIGKAPLGIGDAANINWNRFPISLNRVKALR